MGHTLKVTLAGYNLDTGTLADLAAAAYSGATPPARESLTPETLSAAYARISRNPAEVGELREISRREVARARKSNERIIFGLGHASVAEHAVFNLDVVGLSRLGVEALERHRLAAYTEKSQRYIKLDGDFVLPHEIEQAGLTGEFAALIRRQNEAYFSLYPLLLDYFTAHYEEKGAKNPEKRAKSRAAEDARYVVSLATQAQFGMTANARTLEIMIRDALAHPLEEVREAGRRMRAEVHGLAPSLVKYVEATGYEREQFENTAWWPEETSGENGSPEEERCEVTLIDADTAGEERALAALLVRRRGIPFRRAAGEAAAMTGGERRDLVLMTLRSAAPWDPAPREWELADFTFELIVSAAAFGQLKRHRMATLILGPYDPSLGWTIPESVRRAGGEARFNEVMDASAHLARRIAEINPAAAAYALTNAHRRRVIFKANAREMVHISRLREDLHAQWDIRSLAKRMVALAREKAPALLLLAVGKHAFERKRGELYGEKNHAAP